MKKRYDYIVIGSGFGGSVSALRLAEKGYSVAVLERGKRFQYRDYAESNWNLKKAFWLPQIGLYGIQAMTLLKDVFILHGAGVGGGSLVYANNLLTPPDEVFEDPIWGGPEWKQEIMPYYDRARKMLGAVQSPVITKGDEFLRECAEEAGCGETFHINDVSVYFGEADVEVPDPYFDGKGPTRTGCIKCGACMTGCRNNAKNTLDMNYLYLAEGLGVDVFPETNVTNVIPAIYKGGYFVETRSTTGLFKRSRLFQAKGIIFAGGVMGTLPLLFKCKQNGSLPKLSDQLGNVVRTNSEALVGSVAKDRSFDYSEGIAITSGIYPDENTHIETVRYGKGHDAMSMIATMLVGGGKPWPRPLRYLAGILTKPGRFLRSILPRHWAQRCTILLVMQKIDNYLRFEYKPRWYLFGKRALNSNWNTEKKVPSYIPIANEYAERMSAKIGGESMSVLPEVMFDTSSTAHILGGAIMSKSASEGVIDFSGKIHGYDDLYVIDGSSVPVNLGVNPSLTITALAEYFMEQMPEK